jgi:hypothetical protein
MGTGPSCPRGENALLQPTPQYDDIAGWESRICNSRSLPPAATASQLRPEAICVVQLPFVVCGLALGFTISDLQRHDLELHGATIMIRADEVIVIPEGLLCGDPWRTWRSPRLDEMVLNL